jgi:hypothetical protein
MLGGLVRLVLFRVLGARVLLGIAVFEWLRRALSGRRTDTRTDLRGEARRVRSAAAEDESR